MYGTVAPDGRSGCRKYLEESPGWHWRTSQTTVRVLKRIALARPFSRTDRLATRGQLTDQAGSCLAVAARLNAQMAAASCPRRPESMVPSAIPLRVGPGLH